MGIYIHFTDEQKYRANNVDLADFLAQRGERLLPSGREKRVASDKSITVRGNEWYDHSTEKGGYAIDFVRQFYNLTFPEAMTLLLGGEQGEVYQPANRKQEKAKRPFALPNANADMRRAYAYLVKSRHIDHEVVSFFVRKKLLYESCETSKDGSKEYHNAIFVGLDENGLPRHAHKQGIYTFGDSFKGNVDSSSPAYSFHYIGTSNQLFVFEAPIDMLSYISLHPKEWKQHSYVALCGVGAQPIQWMFAQNANLTAVALCLDNDEAGHKASARIGEQLLKDGYVVERFLSQGKDWNDDVIELKNENMTTMQLA